MLTLAIDTATDQVSVAIGDAERVHGSVELGGGKRHAETLMPAIDWLCRTTAIDIHEIELIAADVGPGLFTGMRVGLATAVTLATTLHVPTRGVTSLDLLGLAARDTHRHVAALVDARKGQVFYAVFGPTHGGIQRLTEPAVGTVDDAVAAIDRHAGAHGTLCVGDGALRYAAELASASRPHTVGGQRWAYPSAAELVRFAAAHGPWSEPLAPLYLRAPDAQINWVTRESAR